MATDGRGPGGKLGPPPCALGRWGDAAPPEEVAAPSPPPPPEEPEEEVYFCDLCGAEMLNRHCKLVCPACGYQRDCSDP